MNTALNDVRLYRVEMLHLLWGLLPLLGLLYWAARSRQEALRSFADSPTLQRLRPAISSARRRGKEALLVLGVAAVIVGLARPAWNPVDEEIMRRGRDVVFVLDVSRSMLAQDLAPNRLERAKLAIGDAIERLSGDRVGLVAFAGAASVKCPLTSDYGFFRMALEDLSPDSVPVGGTMIGDALRKTLSDVFDGDQTEYRDVVLITDGEDHDSFPLEAAQAVGAAGIRLIAIGLGDENVGRRIPMSNERGERVFMQYDGAEVWSRLDAATLRRMAAETPGGRYLNVATGAIDFGDVYRQLILSASRRDIDVQTVQRYQEKFQIFLALGFFLLCGEMVVRERSS